jgi:hypothetical protein
VIPANVWHKLLTHVIIWSNTNSQVIPIIAQKCQSNYLSDLVYHDIGLNWYLCSQIRVCRYLHKQICHYHFNFKPHCWEVTDLPQLRTSNSCYNIITVHILMLNISLICSQLHCQVKTKVISQFWYKFSCKLKLIYFGFYKKYRAAARMI